MKSDKKNKGFVKVTENKSCLEIRDWNENTNEGNIQRNPVKSMIFRPNQIHRPDNRKCITLPDLLDDSSFNLTPRNSSNNKNNLFFPTILQKPLFSKLSAKIELL